MLAARYLDPNGDRVHFPVQSRCFWEQPLSLAWRWQQMRSMPERRRYPRFITWLPIRLTTVAGKIEPAAVTLVTQNISKAGLCFPTPRRIEPGQAIEVEVALAGLGPDGKDIQISGAGYVVRTEPGNKPGWNKLAAEFYEPPGDDERGWPQLADRIKHPSGSLLAMGT